MSYGSDKSGICNKEERNPLVEILIENGQQVIFF